MPATMRRQSSASRASNKWISPSWVVMVKKQSNSSPTRFSPSNRRELHRPTLASFFGFVGGLAGMGSDDRSVGDGNSFPSPPSSRRLLAAMASMFRRPMLLDSAKLDLPPAIVFHSMAGWTMRSALQVPGWNARLTVRPTQESSSTAM